MAQIKAQTQWNQKFRENDTDEEDLVGVQLVEAKVQIFYES